MSLKYRELTKLIIKNINRRKLRSTLTILSVIIGIGAVISLILLTDGLLNSINSEFNKMGSNTIFIVPLSNLGVGSNPHNIGRLSKDTMLNMKDVDNIEKIQEVKTAIPFVMFTTKVTYKNEDNSSYVMVAPANKIDKTFEFFNMKLDSGKFFNGKEGHNVIIGSYISKELFDKEIKSGREIKINNINFKVIGVLEAIGSSQDDSSIYMTRKSAKEIQDFGDTVNQISVKAKNKENIDYVKKKIEKKLEINHTKDMFTVMTAKQIISMFKKMLNTIKAILSAIAGISIVVGALGIMNSVYTSVLERTREIGILKSIGAKISDILYLFVVESSILAFIGGIVGILLGFGIAKGVAYYASTQNFTMFNIILTPQIIIFALSLSIIVGIIAGLFPAYKAAKMNPVDALRN